jgi:predicted transposase YbfD/YdcC
MMEQPISNSFLDYFSQIEDPRLGRMRLHSIEEILLVTLFGLIANCDGWNDIETFAKAKIEFLKTFLPFPNGCPSDDTCRRFFRAVDPKAFQTCFIKWVEYLKTSRGEFISIDGKTHRGSRDDSSEENKALHLVSAFASNARLVLGQEAVSDKSNEITAIPILLKLLDLKGMTVTIDAMGCQKNIAAQIKAQEGDYIFGLKGNQGNLCEEVKELFDCTIRNKKQKVLDTHTVVEKGHGRIEVRTCRVLTAPEDMLEKEKWIGLNTLIEIEAERIIEDHSERHKRYYISSQSNKDASWFNSAIRSHWLIENGLHWVMDVVFKEDDSRIRRGNAPHNIAIIRQAALNMLQTAKSKRTSIKALRKLAGWETSILEKVLLGIQL